MRDAFARAVALPETEEVQRRIGQAREAATEGDNLGAVWYLRQARAQAALEARGIDASFSADAEEAAWAAWALAFFNRQAEFAPGPDPSLPTQPPVADVPASEE